MAQKTGDPVSLIAVEQPRLASELGALPAGDWARNSLCAGWTNLQVLAHLVAGAEFYFDSVSRALKGDSGPPIAPDSTRVDREEFRELLPRRQRELSQCTATDVLERYAVTGERLLDLMRLISAADQARPAWHYNGTRTIGTLIGFRVYELGFHGWDIRAAVGEEAEVRADLCPFLTELTRRLQMHLCRPTANFQGKCRFAVGNQVWVVHAQGGTIEESGEGLSPRAEIRTDPSTYLLLATGRQAPIERAERISIQGDRSWAESLLKTLSFSV